MATKDAAAAQAAVDLVQKEVFLDELQNQGLLGVRVLSSTIKVRYCIVVIKISVPKSLVDQ
jgi:hypothetical protein